MKLGDRVVVVRGRGPAIGRTGRVVRTRVSGRTYPALLVTVAFDEIADGDMPNWEYAARVFEVLGDEETGA